MRLCYQEAVSYYCSVIVGKPYLTILRGSTGYGGSLLSPRKPCVEHAHRIVGWRKRLITEQTSSEFHCLCTLLFLLHKKLKLDEILNTLQGIKEGPFGTPKHQKTNYFTGRFLIF